MTSQQRCAYSSDCVSIPPAGQRYCTRHTFGDAGSRPDELGEHARAPARLPQAGAQTSLSSKEMSLPAALYYAAAAKAQPHSEWTDSEEAAIVLANEIKRLRAALINALTRCPCGGQPGDCWECRSDRQALSGDSSAPETTQDSERLRIALDEAHDLLCCAQPAEHLEASTPDEWYEQRADWFKRNPLGSAEEETKPDDLTEAIWKHCRVLFYPGPDDPYGDYPLEHAPGAGKDMRAAIEHKLRERCAQETLDTFPAETRATTSKGARSTEDVGRLEPLHKTNTPRVASASILHADDCPALGRADHAGCVCQMRSQKASSYPNPLDPTNKYFRKCLKGHVSYSVSFRECPSCKIERERSENGGTNCD